MDKKIKTGIGAFHITGIVFFAIGLIFTIVSLFLFGSSENDREILLMFLIFFVVGIIFLGIGTALLISIFIRRNKIRQVVASGNYVYAEVMDIERNYNMNINGRNPYVISCKYKDPAGTVHIFKSRNLFFNPQEIIRNTQVRVYVDKDNMKYYYVDIDEIMPKVVNH